ncbi:MAG: hypothetical protein K6A43_06075 [Treponema sp.]|nr:hypothetical protein [Treponema sp.]
MEKEEINYDKVEIALKEMQQTQTDAVNSIYDKLIEINSSELCKSSVFEEYPSPTRNILNDSEILSEDEEEIFINSMSDKQKEEIIKTAQIYFDKYSEIAKIRVFDENDIPDGLVETDEAVYIGDMVYSKMTPDGLSRVYELAKAYYDVEKSNRGAYLGVKVSLNSVPVFQAAWPSGKIAYAFDDFPSKYKSEMRKCMDEWEIGSNNLIKFSETSSFNWWRNI